MSDVGVSVSRLLTKSGRVPPVVRTSAVARAPVIVQPVSGAWQVPQLLPLVPCAVKNALVRSTDPEVEYVAEKPNSLGIGILFGISSKNCSTKLSCPASSNSGADSAHAATHTPTRTNVEN